MSNPKQYKFFNVNVMIYYVLGIFAINLLFGNCRAQNEAEQIENSKKTKCSEGLKDMHKTEFDAIHFEIVCEIDAYKQAYCTKGTKSIDEIPTLPTDTIPSDVNIITLNTHKNYSWKITDHTMFHRFNSLKALYLQGPVRYDLKYYEENTDLVLINELFNIPSLTIAVLERWKQGDNYHWKFPKNIEFIHLERYGYTYFDLSRYPNLISLNFEFNKLKKIPKLSDPPPPLENLYLSCNPDIEITVFDIVHLCNLRNLGLSVFNKKFSPIRKYCECLRLEKFMHEYRIEASDHFVCNDLKADCKDYPFEEVKSLREEKCLDKLQKQIQNKNNEEQSWLEEHSIILLLCTLIAFLLPFSVIIFFGRQHHAHS